MKRSRLLKLLTILVMVAVVAVGCSKKAATQSTAPAPAATAPATPPSYGSPEKAVVPTSNIKGAANNATVTTTDSAYTVGAAPAEGSVARKVIQTGRMELEVLDYAKASDEITALAKGAGGYIESTSSRKNNEGRIYGSLTIRVPQEKFDQLLVDLSRSGKIISSDVSGRDLTEQYIDLEARLNNAKAQEQRMLAILAKAEKLEDLLRVEAELARIRGDVESLQGKFNYLKNSVDLASLTISVREVDSFSTKVKTPGWDIWERIQRSFISSVNAIIDVVVAIFVAILGFSPVIILLGALYLLLRRSFHGRFRRPKAVGFGESTVHSPQPTDNENKQK
ncbi:MAG: DUF4349 domain-containing protein [Bacillota bacterium]